MTTYFKQQISNQSLCKKTNFAYQLVNHRTKMIGARGISTLPKHVKSCVWWVRSFSTSEVLRSRPLRVPPPKHETERSIYDPWFDSSTRGRSPRTQSGGKYTVTVIPGVGIGKSMLEATLDVFQCCGAPVDPEWVHETGSLDAIDYMTMSIQRTGVAIKGNIEDRPLASLKLDEDSYNFLFLEALDLFIKVTPLKSFKGLKHVMKGKEELDVILIRSNTEGEFSLLEHEVLPGLVEDLRSITAYNSKRVAEFAFKLARREKRKKVTMLYQSEMIPKSEHMIEVEFMKVAREYPDIEHEMMRYHRAVNKILNNGRSFDVIVSHSVYSSQLADMMTALIGGPRLVASGDVNTRYAVFEPTVNSKSRQLMGKNEANPTAFLLCGAYALKHLGFPELCSVIIESIEETFISGVMTKDIGGTATTDEFIENVVKFVRLKTPKVMCRFDNPTSQPAPSWIV